MTNSRPGSGSGDILRRPSEVLRRGYIDEEVRDLYGLARIWLESGEFRAAETVLNGLINVAPDFYPAWLAIAYIRSAQGQIEEAEDSARQALKIAPDRVESMLLLVATLLTQEDYNSAGTLLGEIGELIEAGQVDDINLVRFYKMQLARFHVR